MNKTTTEKPAIAYVLIGLYGGIMHHHEVYMDWKLAHERLDYLKDQYDIKTVDISEDTHHIYAHDSEGEMPYIENELFVLPSRVAWTREDVKKIVEEGVL